MHIKLNTMELKCHFLYASDDDFGPHVPVTLFLNLDIPVQNIIAIVKVCPLPLRITIIIF